MNKKTPMETLDDTIHRLELEQVRARETFRNNLRQANDLVNPATIIRNLTGSGREDEEEPTTLTGNIMGLAGGFLLKKLLFGSMQNPLLKLAGLALQQGVASYISKHPEPILQTGKGLLQKLFRKKRTPNEPEDHE